MINERSVVTADPHILFVVIVFTIGIIILSEIKRSRKES
jgi:hypothetical protein